MFPVQRIMIVQSAIINDQTEERVPLSKKDARYIMVKMGMSHKSTFRYSFLSCSGVSFGGGGSFESPPKSRLETVSTISSFFFSTLAWSESLVRGIIFK